MSGWIWRLAPEFRLRLYDHGCVAVQVTHVNREPHAILKAGALRLGNQFEIEEGPKDAGLRVLHQNVGRRIDALHAGDKDEVPGPGAETPGPLGLDRTRGSSVLTPFGGGGCDCAKPGVEVMAMAVTTRKARRCTILGTPSQVI